MPLEFNETIRAFSTTTPTVYADCESKLHSINLENVQLLVLVLFQQNKWRASFHIYSSQTEKK